MADVAERIGALLARQVDYNDLPKRPSATCS
jgi:hypothetical protein